MVWLPAALRQLALVGARRQVFNKSELTTKSERSSWLNSEPAELAMIFHAKRKQIFHFLLPDSGMANFSDKTVKQRYPDDFKALDSWRKVYKSFAPHEIVDVQRIGGKVETLWNTFRQQLKSRASENRRQLPGMACGKYGSSSLFFKQQR